MKIYAFLTMILVAGGIAQANPPANDILPEKYLVVPNRSDSTITLLSTPEGEILKKVTAEDVGEQFEPIYASALPRFHFVVISDRKNSKLLFFDDRDFRYLGHVPTSNGMFHMWPTPDQKEIFAVADVDRVVDAIEVNRRGDEILYRKRRIEVGSHFTSGTPHDVVVDTKYIFVTMIGVEAAGGQKSDYVLRYDRKNLNLLNQKQFSFDIHLGMPLESPYLLVPEQTDGELNFIDRESFEVVHSVKGVAGAHGIYWNKDASRIFLANFTSQGPMSVYEVRRKAGTVQFNVEKISTKTLPDAKAHNLVADFANQRLFVTHSGPNKDGQLNRNVAVFSIAGDLHHIKSVETGSNPLGILLVERKPLR